MTAANRILTRRILAFLLILLSVAALLSPAAAHRHSAGNVVRVGWFESPFNRMDDTGRRSGYAYEYQQRIAAYSGWTYEYVVGSWPDLLQMLMDGRIDLLADVSYTEARTETMLFPSLPMGTEDYYLYIAPGNESIRLDDYATFNGKRVGVNKGSVQVGFFQDWAAASGVQAEVVELTCSQEEAIAMLRRGDIDMYVSLDGFFNAETAVPVCKVGSSNFFFAVSKARPELLGDLNSALSLIQTEDPYYNEKLHVKYMQSARTDIFLSPEEKEWLADHGTIRVGYQDNYLAFCASDPVTGELTGALKEYLRVAADCLAGTHLDFSATAFPTSAAAMEAMKNGEIDCVFPANFTVYDGEVQGFFMTSPLMRTDMLAVVRASDQKSFFQKDRVAVAVNAGNPNYDIFLQEHFPTWNAVYFKDTPECLRAIADGKADCLLLSNYRYNNIAELCRKYDLGSLSTGVEMDYCFAVRRSDTALNSILSKTAGAIPDATVNSALSYYYTEDARMSLGDVLRQNLGIVAAAAVAVAVAFLFLAVHNARAMKRLNAEHRLISATETDELTGLYSKNYFYEYAEQMYRQHPERAMDAIVVNIEQFHSVNALKGRSFGDETLQVLGNGIQDFLRENEGIASREESDHFSIYCQHMEGWRGLFDRLQGILNTLSPNANIRLRMGVMPWQKDMEPQQMIEQARVACGLARGHFTERLVVFDDAVREREAFEHRLMNDLRRALDSDEFEVHYQPKYNIQTEPPRLVSAEALVRWRHPELGMISPGDFIPLLERTGRITAVDKYVWTEAARQVMAWKEKYGVTIPVSVNLSRIDVFDPALENTLDSLLAENGLRHSDLKLEVTESACTENADQVIEVIERLRRKGFEIEMDDFGSGYSSLNMLSALPINVLKMDRAFVSNMEFEEKDLQLVELILGIARSLKIPVIAEGVETETQLRLLKELGCELVQGYYFSRPLPAAEFEAILKKAVFNG